MANGGWEPRLGVGGVSSPLVSTLHYRAGPNQHFSFSIEENILHLYYLLFINACYKVSLSQAFVISAYPEND